MKALSEQTKGIMKAGIVIALMAAASLPGNTFGHPSDSQQVSISDQKAEVERLSQLLRKDPSFPASCGTRKGLVKALRATGAPARDLVEAAGRSFCGIDPLFYYQLAVDLNHSGEFLDEALQYAEWAYRRYPNDALNINPYWLVVSIRAKRGEFDWLINTLSKAASWDTFSYAWLGLAYEKTNRIDEALDAYIQAEGARRHLQATALSSFSPGIVEMPNPNIEDLYRKRYGTLNGLDERLRAAGRSAWQAIYVDPYRIENPSFQWTLKDLSWTAIGLYNYRDKIVVLCFVQMDYEPTLEQLTQFQKASDKYKSGDVIFLVVDVNERFVAPEIRRQNILEAFKKNGIKFPVLMEEYVGNVRRLLHFGQMTAGVVLIDRQHTRAYRSSIFYDGPQKTFRILDYLIEEATIGRK